jgi:esterase
MLNHDTITAGDARPDHWLYVLHGIYGAGRNWASVMRGVVKERPEWGAVLIDLRQHGRSQGFPAPHTVQAAAADLVELADATGLVPSAVLGHSFGGKVALIFAGMEADATSHLRQVWVVDSTPDARDPGGSAWSMLNIVRSLPDRFATREALVDALVAHRMQRPVAQWMATNLEAEDDGTYRWRFDLDALEALLHSFFETDAWSIVESPRRGLEVHLIKAEDSTVLDGESLVRAEAAASHGGGEANGGEVNGGEVNGGEVNGGEVNGGEVNGGDRGRAGPSGADPDGAGTAGRGRTFLHRVAGGHWVNAENPAAVQELLISSLPR